VTDFLSGDTLNFVVESRDYEFALTTINHMVGGIVMAVLLLLSPFIITISLVAIAALLGNALKEDAETRHEGSSLVETNR
tara:strand:+ start:313 stop:552 length:240 start_codon:yes stop_codon:yes gene_type:complete